MQRSPQKHVESVLDLIPLDLQETRFRMDWLQKITKIRSADKYMKYLKICRNEVNIHEKTVPELNKKRFLKTEPNKQNKNSKNHSQMGPQRSKSAPKDRESQK